MRIYTTDGRLSFYQFVRFLEKHNMKLAGSEIESPMFDQIKTIHDLYLEIELNTAYCPNMIKYLTCLRGWSDEKSRLRKILGAEKKSTKVSTMSLISSANNVYSQVKQQLNFLSKCFITNKIYWASLLVQN